MAITIARLQAVLSANTRDFDRAMTHSEGRLKAVGKAGALAAGVAGVGALIYTFKSGFDEWKKQQLVAAQTNAVIKSTGGVARVSAEHVSALGNALLRKSGIDDEVIKSGENMLLTFRRIRNETGKGNDIFDQATKAVTDLDVVMSHGHSTQESMAKTAIRVGKALNDPIKGITALRRVGVQFTTAQEDQIKALVASGHQMQAQKMILRELNAEFGGSAKALGSTFQGRLNLIRESFRNWASDLIEKMIPTLNRLFDWVEQNWPQIRTTFVETWEGIKPTIIALGQLIASTVGFIRRNWSTIGPIVRSVVLVIKAQLAIITAVIRVFAAVLRGDWSAAWNALKGLARSVLNEIWTLLKAYVTIYATIGKAIGKALLQGFTAAISGGWKALKKAVTDLFGQVVGWVKGIFGIKSPSTVFHGLGQQLIRGFINGVGSMGGVLKKAVLGIAGGALHAAGSFFSSGKNTLAGTSSRVRGAVAFAQSHGWQGQITSGFRTYAEQARLYQRYLNGGPLAAAPGTSSHERGQAVDVTNPSAFARAMSMMPVWARLYNRLGAADPVHFSVTGYDKGGWLPQGLSLAMNNTGRPERVGGDIVVPVSIGGEHIATVVFDMLRRKAHVFENRNRRPAW